jgi:hypothetical protein
VATKGTQGSRTAGCWRWLLAAALFSVCFLGAVFLLLWPRDAAPPLLSPRDEQPTLPVPLSEEAEILYATGQTSPSGVVEMLPSPGVTITVRIQSVGGDPVEGATVVAVSEAAALTLLTYAPGYRPDLRTLGDDRPIRLRRGGLPEPPQAVPLFLAPEAEAYLAPGDVRIDTLLSIPAHLPGWQLQSWATERLCGLLAPGEGRDLAVVLMADVSPAESLLLGWRTAPSSPALCREALARWAGPGQWIGIRHEELPLVLAMRPPSEPPASAGLLYGRVLRRDWTPVAEAVVSVDGSWQQASTWPSGWYFLEAAGSGRLTLRAGWEGWLAAPVEVEVRPQSVTFVPDLLLPCSSDQCPPYLDWPFEP